MTSFTAIYGYMKKVTFDQKTETFSQKRLKLYDK